MTEPTEWIFGCDYTENYDDEPHGIICVSDGECNYLMDVDVFHEGPSYDEVKGYCPDCARRVLTAGVTS